MKKTQDLNYNYCRICCKPIRFSINFENNIHICKSCYQKLPFIYEKFKLDGINCLSIYKYDEFMKQIIYQIKALYDLELAKTILIPAKEFVKVHYHDYIILPMPSSKTSNLKRGFNHVVEVFKTLDMKMIDAFYKVDNYKQSSQAKLGRLNVRNHLFLRENCIKTNKKYLLVDDITTTGQTIKTAIDCLKKLGVKSIKVLVLCKKERGESHGEW